MDKEINLEEFYNKRAIKTVKRETLIKALEFLEVKYCL